MRKFYTWEELIAPVSRWKIAGRTVVFTHGGYVLLHFGHIRLLEKARSLRDILVLALNSDVSVRPLKGSTRPLIPETGCAELAALEAADDCAHWIAGRQEVKTAGAPVFAINLEAGCSTTGIVEQLLARP